MAAAQRIRKLNSLELEVTVTREFHVRVAVALLLIRCAAWVLGGRMHVKSSDEEPRP